METRTIVRQVVFREPFRLAGMEELHPAGAYTVRTEQEMLDSLVCLGWRTMSASVEIFRDGAIEHVPIDAQDLRAAVARESGGEALRHSTPPGRRARNLMRRGGRW